MHIHKRLSVSIIVVIFTAVSMLGIKGTAHCGAIPQKGEQMPSFQLPSPAAENDRAYLGLKGANFELKDVETRLLVVEILGVYCPFCYQQAPLFSKLYTRLQKKNLADKVKMLGVAAGGTPMEVEYLRTNGSYDFPIVSDESYAVHKLLGEPRTPFTMLLSRDGKVLHTHLSVMEDIDGFLTIIEDNLK